MRRLRDKPITIENIVIDTNTLCSLAVTNEFNHLTLKMTSTQGTEIHFVSNEFRVKVSKKLWCCFGRSNKVIWLYQLS